MIPTRPMLAAPCSTGELYQLRYPLLVSPKLDGIRVLCHPALGAVTRKFKPVPNIHICETLSTERYQGLDGEILLRGEDGNILPFNPIQSAVMSQYGNPDFEYWVFDYFMLEEPFRNRQQYVLEHIHDYNGVAWCKVVHVPQVVATNADMALHMAGSFLAGGYEGIVLRDPEGPYKSNRSTFKQQWMVKYKGEREDAEGVVVGFEELLRNQNPQERDELGLADRSDRKEGMVPAGTLGALILNTEPWGEVRVGSGLDGTTRDHIWANRDSILGKAVTFWYTKYGMKDKPRFPIYKAIRMD